MLWAAFYGTLGYLFGSNLPRLEHLLGRTSLIALLAAVLLAALIYLGRRKALGLVIVIVIGMSHVRSRPRSPRRSPAPSRSARRARRR